MFEPVTLREITDLNRPAVLGLRVAAEQEGFVDGVAPSLREAAEHPELSPWPRAVYAGEQPVGFVLLADGVAEGNPDVPWPFYLWRMLIDGRFQGRGYGRAALDSATAHLRSRPDARELMTSVVPGEGSPLGFYLRYGFVETGEMHDHEHVLRLAL
ncbi:MULTISPECIES: N-acetyltransferase [Streptomyces]|uniref:GNAT family N-acetyltransferase n=1 Tax=Streptomyces TaxID=1883 RepID=UPI000241ADEF|nr:MULTISPECIES: GNAT family N-acetyltransferase [Streptomyces]EHM29156.1 GCN5-related N-acetyltransferase [Streptomyces sp. W007]WSI77094.1 GNAT family N-acetyltransferase [Streptomyces anulatus]WSU73120.1 GNAT family N-acetyltransferase [Streptomyces anulatus]WTE25749.1 GNAT family N-acetyltransferase [Streptomyces anulatus]